MYSSDYTLEMDLMNMKAYRQWSVAGQHEAEIWLTAALMEIERQDRQTSLTGPELEQYAWFQALCRRIRANPGDLIPGIKTEDNQRGQRKG